jgi:Txe/YoeB family toxin of Txe-Axe toxin-antitoxin module
MDRIEVQAQSVDGNWQTYTITVNQPLAIKNAMEQLKWQFPDKRVRAIDENGRLVDFMA